MGAIWWSTIIFFLKNKKQFCVYCKIKCSILKFGEYFSFFLNRSVLIQALIFTPIHLVKWILTFKILFSLHKPPNFYKINWSVLFMYLQTSALNFVDLDKYKYVLKKLYNMWTFILFKQLNFIEYSSYYRIFFIKGKL